MSLKNRLVLEAMATVPRHEFVPESLRKFAYWDEPLPIGYGQTISQPFIVAFMTEQLTPNRLIECSRLAPDPDTRPLFFRGLWPKSIRSRSSNL
jgi:hypothetical protein